MRKDFFFFWLLILFLPTQLGRHFWPNFSFVSGVRVDFLSPTFYLTDLLVLGLLASFGLRVKIKWEKLAGCWPFFAFFVWLFLVSLLAKIPQLSFLKFLKTLEFFLLGVYLWKEKPFSQVGRPLSLALLYESLIAWSQFFKGASLGGFFWWLGERTFNLTSVNIAVGEISGRTFLRPYGTFSHPNSLAGFFLVCLFLVLRDENLPSWWKSLVGVLVVTVLVISFSQVVWLAAGFAFLFYLIRDAKVKIGLLASFLIFSFLLAMFGILLLPLEFFSTELQERVALSRSALAMIKQSPFWGVGLSGFIPTLPRFWEGKIFLLQPVHNIFLLQAAEAGLLGLLFLLGFFVLLFKKAQKEPFLLLAVLAIFLTGLFDHYWLTLQQNGLLFVLASSSVLALPKSVKYL